MDLWLQVGLLLAYGVKLRNLQHLTMNVVPKPARWDFLWTPASTGYDSCGMVKLRLRSPPSGNTRRFTRMQTPTSSLLLVLIHTPSCFFFPPLQATRHECILNGTRHSHRNPVASRYRYTPNTLGRKCFCWLLFSLHAFVHI